MPQPPTLPYLLHVGEARQDLVLEENRPVAVGLEVHADVVLLRLVVHELDPGLGHRHGHALRLQVPADRWKAKQASRRAEKPRYG